MTDLHRPHWVYRLFAEDGSLLYVGMTHKPARRMTEWRSRAKVDPTHWFHGTQRASWRWYANKVQAMGAERRAVQSEHPAHNVLLREAAQ